MSQIVSRLSAYIEHKKISIRKFEQTIGASNGSISRAIKQESDVYAKWISITVDKFPDLNPIWLLTGKGDMIVEVTQRGDLLGKKDLKSTFSEKNVQPEIQEANSDEDKLSLIVSEILKEKGIIGDKTAVTAENYLQTLLSKLESMEDSIQQLKSDFATLEQKVTED